MMYKYRLYRETTKITEVVECLMIEYFHNLQIIGLDNKRYQGQKPMNLIILFYYKLDIAVVKVFV